jgi:hypothetical protein
MRRTLLAGAAVALVAAGVAFGWTANQQAWLRYPVGGWCGTPAAVTYLEYVRSPSRPGDEWNDAATELLWARTATAFAVGFAAAPLPLRYVRRVSGFVDAPRDRRAGPARGPS